MSFLRFLAAAVLAACATVPFAGAQEPAKGGTLTMVVQPEPPTLVSATNSAGPIGVVSTKILQGLLTYDYDMNPRPSLAETWKVSADGRSDGMATGTATPLPVSGRMFGEVAALVAMVMSALRVPVAVGVKLTAKAQLAPGGRPGSPTGQVFV